MLVLIPHLFPPARLLEAAAYKLRVPSLETLLARGSLQTCPTEGTEAALCQALGIARQLDWPIAPIALESEGQPAGKTYWLRADPVHLRLMRDRIVLTDSDALNLSQQEAEALTASIGEHFGEALHPIPLHPQRWYARFPRPLQLTTTPLSVATGRDIDPLMPQGEDAQKFRSLLNELQMLLFAHTVNQAREARGELAVNSVWLWGGGIKPEAVQTDVSLYARDPLACAMGAFCGAQVNPMPARLGKSRFNRDSVILIDGLTRAGQCGDAYGWREALSSMETDWFTPLLGSLSLTGPAGLRLLDPVNGQVLQLKRTDAWKIWRRSKKLLSISG